MRVLILSLLLFIPKLSEAATCVPTPNSCGYYACVEKNHACGPKGYPLAFGLKFCNIFLNSKKDYSPEATQWLIQVRSCLMNSMQIQDKQKDITCRKIKTEAFRSHVDCYVQTGYCDLKKSDQLKISWAMRASFLKADAIQNAFALKQACRARKGPSPAIPDEPK